ncbi:ABC transporter permease [Neorhizobium sp. P12A]|uniref:ABC transporter permease n=1 Tax=Neorhizobium sp. P12A TaxID=2268027 RepID=UPI0011EF5B02|nr:ABC transporter permease [Neorhizobium sp. P12A]KAA0688098.1 ABC transporter permease [Neorhizobium sp. P12A]
MSTTEQLQRRRQIGGMPPVILVCLGWLAAVILVAIFAGILAPYHYTTQDLAVRFRPPVFLGGRVDHLLGTDHLGRDVLSRLIYALRTSILIAAVGTLLGATIGTSIGLLAGRFRGIIDVAAMMLTDVQTALPSLFIAIAFLAFFGNDIILFIVLVSLEGWERYARLARGLALSEQSADYIRAVEAFGAGTGRIVFRHLLPNIAASLIVQATLNFPGTILLETSLSFLGLGVQPPGTSLGLMLGEGRRYLLNAWWIAVLPGLIIFLTTLAMSLFGDWLRDQLDPTIDKDD